MSQILLSPLAGWSAPLEEVPDPVFSGRMLGDGVAIDPLGSTLHSPCDALVLAVPETKHAVTLRTPQGLDILMHIGIDTVGLAGEGFALHVRPGQQVRAGERLISFDLDGLARRAKSLLTPVLVLEGGGFSIRHRAESRPVAVGDTLMELEPRALPGRAGGHEPGEDVRRLVNVALEHGIHARPAGQIVTALKGLGADVRIRIEGREVNARSAVALMALGVRAGVQVEVVAAGPDAAAAAEAVIAVLAGARDSLAPRTRSPSGPRDLAATAAPAAASQGSSAREPGVLRGVIASRGLAVGAAHVLKDHDIPISERGAGVEHETAELHRAREQVRCALQRAIDSATGTAREIIEAHLTIIDDPELAGRALTAIAGGASAAFAWRSALRESVEDLRALQDPRLRERVDDLIDLERQVLLALSGERGVHMPEIPAGAILIAAELFPSQLVGLEAGALGGICLAAGGATSHVSILAAALGIPTLVALGPEVGRIGEGVPLILDAETGKLYIDPGEGALETARRRISGAAERAALERQAAQRECRTADGERIEVWANVGSLAEARAAVRNGAEGCGLLRTEFLFLERETPPSEQEQRAEYQAIATALAGKPLTLRTLDIGGDKPIPYLPLPREDNPALGLRGVRTSLWRPELLREQLRAALAVRPYGQCRILLPMVTEAAEIRAVRALAVEASREIGRSEPVELGVMIETPASALMAASLAAEADFFSIGTNDLTQYTLAMDRGHAELATRLDALHPAVLRLIAHTVEAALPGRRPVAVCGGLASDPAAAPVLIGLGVRELSCVPSIVPRLKAHIRELTMERCVRLARRALSVDSAEAVRALLAASNAAANEGAAVSG